MIKSQLLISIKDTIENLYAIKSDVTYLKIEETNKDFEGDFTFVVFPFLKFSRKSPEETAKEIGIKLLSNCKIIENFNVVKGFLNIVVNDEVWIDFLNINFENNNFGSKKINPKENPIVVEYSSPNTNKPLHLGHIRNNLIGHSLSKILAFNGNNVKQINLINDRGIHICKTILAWIKWGNNNTPEKLNVKGDKYVGELYVMFEQELKKEVQSLIENGNTSEEALLKSSLMKEAREVLVKWEAEDKEIRSVWSMMNKWVIDGFDQTYKRMNISFDKFYFESESYLEGKEQIINGLKKGVFYQKEDSSIWADLKSEGLDEKLLLRSDGTSVYITQDIGTALIRYNDWTPKQMLYVVGNEQNYHFQVLKIVLQKIGFEWSSNINHVSYGMVELPEGKMKSREGKVVDADDLMDDMKKTAIEISKEAGKINSLEESKHDEVVEMIAQSALKYYILKVDAKKNIVFNPEESIDFNGNTGPFIQYTYARICSLLEKAKLQGFEPKSIKNNNLHEFEKNIVTLLSKFPDIIEESANQLNPSFVAQFSYELAKEYNTMYQNLSVVKEENAIAKTTRLNISLFTANVLKTAFKLLGIEMPNTM